MDTSEVSKTLLTQVAEWLGWIIKEKNVGEQAWKGLEMEVKRAFGGWDHLVQTGIEKGVNAALKALYAVRSEVIKVCRENKEILKHLSKMAVKAGIMGVAVKAVVKTGVRNAAATGAKEVAKEGAKQIAKQGAKQVAKQAAKTGAIALVNPVGIAADIAQAGFEYAGMEKVGKNVGKVGNIAAGAMLGSVAGPPGMVVGALGGFLVWTAGETVGNAIDYAFS